MSSLDQVYIKQKEKLFSLYKNNLPQSIILSGGAMIAPKGSALAGTLSKASKIEPITAATKAVSIPSGFIAKNTIAKLQGTSGDAIGAGFAAGQKGGESSAAFSRAISGTDDPIKIAEDANEAFNKMKKDKQVEFMNAKDRLKLDKTKIDVNKVQTEILDLIDTKYFNSFTDLSKNSEKILNNIKIKSVKNNIDPRITKRIWKNMIWSYIDYEKRNFKKK